MTELELAGHVGPMWRSDSILDGDGLSGARVLLLEDEFLIAMDVEQLCRDNGAKDVSIMRNLSETQEMSFDPKSFDVAIIDIMLDGQSSLGFAEHLRDVGVPFVFASGYADADDVFATFPGIPVINKPYASDELVGAVCRALRPF